MNWYATLLFVGGTRDCCLLCGEESLSMLCALLCTGGATGLTREIENPASARSIMRLCLVRCLSLSAVESAICTSDFERDQ